MPRPLWRRRLTPRRAQCVRERQWPRLKQRLTEVFRARTRAEWEAILEHSDVCYAPVLTMSEAAQHPHNLARETFIQVGGDTQPAPAPRYSGTPTASPRPAPLPGAETQGILADLGMDDEAITALMRDGAIL